MTQPILLFQLETGCGAAGICSCLSNVHSLFLLSKQKSDESRLAGTRPSRPTALCQWCVQGRKSGSRDVKTNSVDWFLGKIFFSGTELAHGPARTACLSLAAHICTHCLGHGVRMWCFELERPPGDHGATRRRWQRGGWSRWCSWWHCWAAQSAEESLTSGFYISK